MGSYLRCWSLGAHDNMALWKLFGGASASLAITSTVDKLDDMAKKWGEDVFIIKIRYIDHFMNPDMAVGNYTALLEFKNEAYKYEKEVRIIVPRQSEEWEHNPPSIRLSAGNLSNLIRSVVVAPEAESWFFDLVEDLTNKYGLTSPVFRSKIANLP